MHVMAAYAKVVILTRYFFGCSAEVCENCWFVVLFKRQRPDALVVGSGGFVFYNLLLPENTGEGRFIYSMGTISS